MATANSTTNDASYVAGNLADAAMFIQSAMRLIDMLDGEAYCLLDMAHKELIFAQGYLESMDPVESPISKDVAAMLARVGSQH